MASADGSVGQFEGAFCNVHYFPSRLPCKALFIVNRSFPEFFAVFLSVLKHLFRCSETGLSSGHGLERIYRGHFSLFASYFYLLFKNALEPAGFTVQLVYEYLTASQGNTSHVKFFLI